MDINIKRLLNQDAIALRNTYYVAPKVYPSARREEDYIVIKTIDEEFRIHKGEEVILQIIADFKFSPIWLVMQWFEKLGKSKEEAEKLIGKMVSVGLVWAETSSTGVYLRPTKYLFELLKVNLEQYSPIPYNMLTHTVSEMEVSFLAQSGIDSSMNDIISEYNLMPYFSSLELKHENERGTIILREANFRSYNVDQRLIDGNAKIRSQSENKETFTEEFKDFTLFPIIYKNNKGELASHIPDLIIPVPRVEGKPKSIAIEVELSAKSVNRYVDILNIFKNNNRFGIVLYLCDSPIIAKRLRLAFNKIKGMGETELVIIEFHPPEIDKDYFFLRSQENEKKIKEISEKTTEKEEVPKRKPLSVIKAKVDREEVVDSTSESTEEEVRRLFLNRNNGK